MHDFAQNIRFSFSSAGQKVMYLVQLIHNIPHQHPADRQSSRKHIAVSFCDYQRPLCSILIVKISFNGFDHVHRIRSVVMDRQLISRLNLGSKLLQIESVLIGHAPWSSVRIMHHINIAAFRRPTDMICIYDPGLLPALGIGLPPNTQWAHENDRKQQKQKQRCTPTLLLCFSQIPL